MTPHNTANTAPAADNSADGSTPRPPILTSAFPPVGPPPVFYHADDPKDTPCGTVAVDDLSKTITRRLHNHYKSPKNSANKEAYQQEKERLQSLSDLFSWPSVIEKPLSERNQSVLDIVERYSIHAINIVSDPSFSSLLSVYPTPVSFTTLQYVTDENSAEKIIKYLKIYDHRLRHNLPVSLCHRGPFDYATLLDHANQYHTHGESAPCFLEHNDSPRSEEQRHAERSHCCSNAFSLAASYLSYCARLCTTGSTLTRVHSMDAEEGVAMGTDATTPHPDV